jgi:hypothetical protein
VNKKKKEQKDLARSSRGRFPRDMGLVSAVAYRRYKDLACSKAEAAFRAATEKKKTGLVL